MPELLTLDTPDWKLVVWSKDISQSQKQLNRTLSTRHKKQPGTHLRFNPLLHIIDLDSRESQYTYSDEPLFFENKLYEFDFQFHVGRLPTNPVINHRLQAIEDAFHYSGNSLRGSINFGNAVGWFKLILNYRLNDKNLARHPRYISPWDIHVQRFIPLGRLN
jgi:hypothetical protein